VRDFGEGIWALARTGNAYMDFACSWGFAEVQGGEIKGYLKHVTKVHEGDYQSIFACKYC
jgi:hypothetical protein